MGATITMLVLLASALSGCQASDHVGVLGRADRLLQTGSVKLTFTRDPAVKKNCDDAGIPEADISITNEQRKELQAKVSGRYSNVLVKVETAMSDSSNTNDLVNAAFGTGLGFGIICGSLAFLSLIFLFIWAISECCCKKTCCAETQKKAEGRGWFRWCCFISSAVLGLTTIALTIAYAVFLGKLGNRTPELKCAISIVKSDLINGVAITSTSVFVGTTQADVLLGYYIEMIDSINSIKANAENVKLRQLTSQANTVVSKESSYRTNFNAATFNHKGVRNPATLVTVGFATQIGSALSSKALETEAATLAATAKSIDDAVVSIASYDPSSLDKTRSSLQKARTNMKTQITDKINSLYSDLASDSSSGADQQIKKASQGFMIASIVIMIGLTVIYLVILGFNIKDRWHPMKCVSKIIMLLELLLAVLILFLGALFTAIAIFITFFCVAIDGSISTPNYLATNLQGAKVSTDLQNIVNGCLYEKGDGNLFVALGIDLSNTEKFNTISAGIQTYVNFRPNLTSTTETKPYIGGRLSADLAKGITNDLELAGSPATEDTKTGMADFNAYGCVNDQMSLKTIPAGRTPSADNEAFNVQKGNPFVFLRTSGNFDTANGHFYAARYDPGDCTTLSSFGINDATANNRLSNILKAQVELFNVYPALQTSYNAGFYTAESGLFQSMRDSVTDLDKIYANVKGAVDYLNSAGSTLPLLLDCRVMQKDVIILANVLCYRVGEDIYQSAGIGLALGFIIFVYAWVMCCSIRLANPQEEKEGPGALAYQDNQGYPQQNNYQDGQNKEQYNTYQ